MKPKKGTVIAVIAALSISYLLLDFVYFRYQLTDVEKQIKQDILNWRPERVGVLKRERVSDVIKVPFEKICPTYIRTSARMFKKHFGNSLHYFGKREGEMVLWIFSSKYEDPLRIPFAEENEASYMSRGLRFLPISEFASDCYGPDGDLVAFHSEYSLYLTVVRGKQAN